MKGMDSATVLVILKTQLTCWTFEVKDFSVDAQVVLRALGGGPDVGRVPVWVPVEPAVVNAGNLLAQSFFSNESDV